MGTAALAALVYTKGDVRHLVVMYAINVFVTFSLSMLAMLRHSWGARSGGRLVLFLVGFLFCATILGFTVLEKFLEGAWVTLIVTGIVVILCFFIRAHYGRVTRKLNDLYSKLLDVPEVRGGTLADPDPSKRIAAVLVARYGGLGLHTFLSVFRDFPDHFKGVVFLTVGVVDSGAFKGEGTVDELKTDVEENLKKYVAFARAQGVPAAHRIAVGTDAVAEAETLCLEVAREFPMVTFFAGKVLFEKETWIHKVLHNETAMAIQRRLQWVGKTVVVVPARVT
jgi:K+ transporter